MGTEGRPERRLRPSRPRVAELDALLRDVDELRLTLETDLTLAASAVEAGETALAVEILGSDSGAVHRFEVSALGHLDALESAPRRRLLSHVHAGPILVAAALVGVLAGVAPRVLNTQPGPAPESVAVTDSLARIQNLAQNGTPGQLRAASQALHAQLAGMVALANHDPAGAQTALLLLSYEQSAIVNSGDSGALADVLRQSLALAQAIRAALPASSAAVVVPVAEPTQAPSPASSPRPKPSPKPSARPTSSPSAQPTVSPSGNPVPLPTTPSAP